MKRWLISLSIGVVLVVFAVLGQQATSALAEREPSSMELAAIEKKLDALLADHQTILQKLDAIMEELRIVKVRATQ